MALCGTSTLLLAAHWLLAVHLLKVPAVNGTVLAVTIFSQIQVVLSCVLLAATIFWTCIKIAKAKELKESDPALKEVFALDVIGDAKASMDNAIEMTKAKATPSVVAEIIPAEKLLAA